MKWKYQNNDIVVVRYERANASNYRLISAVDPSTLIWLIKDENSAFESVDVDDEEAAEFVANIPHTSRFQRLYPGYTYVLRRTFSFREISST